MARKQWSRLEAMLRELPERPRRWLHWALYKITVGEVPNDLSTKEREIYEAIGSWPERRQAMAMRILTQLAKEENMNEGAHIQAR